MLVISVPLSESIVLGFPRGTLTVNTSSSQTINNAAGVTSITVPANSCVMVVASQTSAASGVFFWAKL